MDSFRPAFAFFGASLALHTALAFSVGTPWFDTGTKGVETIQIDYLQAENPPAPAAKKPRQISVPTGGPKSKQPDKAVSSDFQKFIEDKMKKQQLDLARLSAVPPKAQALRPRTSAEILADPAKGKIFIGYFAEVKKKIQKTLLERYAHRYSGRGSVTLAFVLNAHGQVENVIVASKDEQADEMLQDLAVQCLRKSAPFGNFPQNLESQKITFNITIFFDEK